MPSKSFEKEIQTTKIMSHKNKLSLVTSSQCFLKCSGTCIGHLKKLVLVEKTN